MHINRTAWIVVAAFTTATLGAQRRQPAPEPTATGPVATGADTPQAQQYK